MQLNSTIAQMRAENEQLRAERDELFEANGKLANTMNTKIERLLAELGRVNTLFAMKWDATQSAETQAMRDEIERLQAENKELVDMWWETKTALQRIDNVAVGEGEITLALALFIIDKMRGIARRALEDGK